MKYVVAITLLVIWGVLKLRARGRELRAIQSLAQGLLNLRRLQTEDTEYVPLSPANSLAPEARTVFDAGLADLAAQNMTTLGDFMERRPDGAVHGPVRWFVDPPGTTCGWFAVVVRKKGPMPLMTLFSESNSGAFFYTGRGVAAPRLAQPPSLTRKIVDWSAGLGAAMEQHQARPSAGTDGKESLRTVTSAEDAIEMLQRLRLNTRTWRLTQDPTALIEADARAVLGKQYDRFGTAVIQLATAPAKSSN